MMILKFSFTLNHRIECLISEDCPNAEYCDLKTNLCKNACSLNGK